MDYTVTLPDGETISRRAARTFTHVVVRRNATYGPYYVNFASSEEKARRESRVLAAGRDYIEVVEFVDGHATATRP